MSLIPNHHSLNVAYNGSHWARVEFSPGTDEKTAKMRSRQIAEALRESYGTPEKWSFGLTRVLCHGEEVKL